MSENESATAPGAGSDPASIDLSGAWAYEQLHVEALFRQWAAPLLDAALVVERSSVLDVACGTGIVAREAFSRVGAEGSVVGLDIGADMVGVAEAIEPRIEWHEGDAASLPFAGETFDAVVCQFGLMFFPDRVSALREMIRCSVPGGRVVAAVWDDLDRSEAYPLSVDLFARRLGSDAADALRAPFVLGNTAELMELFSEAGAEDVSVETRRGKARFPSVRSMVEADLRGWLPVMGVEVDEGLIEPVLAEAEEVLSSYVDDGGQMVFEASAHIVTAVV